MMGEWELLSFNGQALPAEVGTGQVMVSGSCLLTKEREFRMEFSYEGETQDIRSPRNILGGIEYFRDEGDAGQWRIRFLAQKRDVHEGPLESSLWTDIKAETLGSVQGDELVVGGVGDFIGRFVFRKVGP